MVSSLNAIFIITDTNSFIGHKCIERYNYSLKWTYRISTGNRSPLPKLLIPQENSSCPLCQIQCINGHCVVYVIVRPK